jgi:hypothetical protein
VARDCEVLIEEGGDAGVALRYVGCILIKKVLDVHRPVAGWLVLIEEGGDANVALR